MSYKIFIISFTLIFVSQFSWAQNPENELKTADSLFTQKKYTQALKHYHSLFESDTFTPSMLLKMAYINEGLEDFPKTVYYLSKLNELVPNENLEHKIQTLAVNHDLEGYGYSDAETLSNLATYISDYLSPVLFIGLFILLIIYILRPQNRVLPILFILSTMFWIGIQFIDSENKKAVIWHNHTYAYDKASSASKVIATPQRGHRYLVEETDDTWVKLVDGDQVLYIKKSQLKFI